jgi:hypothetical protein
MATLGATLSTTIYPIIYLPFGVYANMSPISTTPAYPYLATVDRTITLVSWFQHIYVATTNNGSHYWLIELYTMVGGVWGTLVDSMNTSALSANVHSQLSTSSFTVGSVGTANVGLWLVCTKSGTPGALSIGGPTLVVTE